MITKVGGIIGSTLERFGNLGSKTQGAIAGGLGMGTIGTGIGALAGAVSAGKGNRMKGALKGGVVGGIGGAGIGAATGAFANNPNISEAVKGAVRGASKKVVEETAEKATK